MILKYRLKRLWCKIVGHEFELITFELSYYIKDDGDWERMVEPKKLSACKRCYYLNDVVNVAEGDIGE